MKRNTTLASVVSLHLAVFAVGAATADHSPVALALGGASAIVLGVALFYETSV